VIDNIGTNAAPFIDRNHALKPNNDKDNEDVKGQKNFADTLNEVLGGVNQLQLDADLAAGQMLTGDIENIHQVMIKTEEARLSLQLTGQVVNKVLDAYQEISRMQI